MTPDRPAPKSKALHFLPPQICPVPKSAAQHPRIQAPHPPPLPSARSGLASPSGPSATPQPGRPCVLQLQAPHPRGLPPPSPHRANTRVRGTLHPYNAQCVPAPVRSPSPPPPRLLPPAPGAAPPSKPGQSCLPPQLPVALHPVPCFQPCSPRRLLCSPSPRILHPNSWPSVLRCRPSTSPHPRDTPLSVSPHPHPSYRLPL